jgi:hypothetical protein
MGNQEQFERENKQQLRWEIWFLISVVIFGAYLFVGMLDGSREYFPNWPYFAMLATINLFVSIIVGTRRK